MIAVVLLDVDGVLTDGSLWVGSGGEESRRIRFDDIDAFFELRRAGLRLGFLTAETTAFGAYLQRRFMPDYFRAGCQDKLAAFHELTLAAKWEPCSVAYAGDSHKDVSLLKHLEWSFAPADAPAAVLRAAKFRLAAARGQGVVRELAEFVLQHNRETRKVAEAHG